MAYKAWNNKILRKQRRIALLNNEIADADILTALLEDSIYLFETPSETDFSSFNKEVMSDYKDYLDYILELSQIKPFILGKPTSMYLSKNSELDFVKDFIKTTYPEWNSLFLKCFKEKKRNLKFGDSDNYTVYLRSFDYSYISINQCCFVNEVFGLVHEYLHAIVDRVFYRETYTSTYPFVELPSINAEFIASLALKDFYLDIESEINYYLKFLFNIIIDFSKNIMAAKNDSRICKNYSIFHDISYVVPFMYAIELFYLYSSDRELWFDRLDNVVKMEEGINSFDKMKKLGLHPNKNLKRFINDLKY